VVGEIAANGERSIELGARIKKLWGLECSVTISQQHCHVEVFGRKQEVSDDGTGPLKEVQPPLPPETDYSGRLPMWHGIRRATLISAAVTSNSRIAKADKGGKGPHGYSGDALICAGDNCDSAVEYFRTCSLEARLEAPWRQPSEYDIPVMLCRGIQRLVVELWPRAKFYD